VPKQTFFNLPEEKRNAILAVAIDEFAENDYHNTSISRIVARADIAKGSFYQYFEDKRDLYMHLLDMAAQEKMAFVQGQQPPDPDMDLFSFLRWLFRVGARFSFSHPRLSRVAYRAIYGDAPHRDEVLHRMQEAASAYYGALIARGIQRGDIDARIDPDVASFVFVTLLNQVGDYIIRRAGLEAEVLAYNTATPEILGLMERTCDELIHVLQYGLSNRFETPD
jgi:AcrR family transcriptional regulator